MNRRSTSIHRPDREITRRSKDTGNGRGNCRDSRTTNDSRNTNLVCANIGTTFLLTLAVGDEKGH